MQHARVSLFGDRDAGGLHFPRVSLTLVVEHVVTGAQQIGWLESRE